MLVLFLLYVIVGHFTVLQQFPTVYFLEPQPNLEKPRSNMACLTNVKVAAAAAVAVVVVSHTLVIRTSITCALQLFVQILIQNYQVFCG